MSNHVLLVLHVYSFTTSMRAVIYCIKETKLNPNDKENVKTTSLLRSPSQLASPRASKASEKPPQRFSGYLSHAILHIWPHNLCPFHGSWDLCL